ncbi:MAG: hypothetical protein JWQ61_2804, partial [Collimonas fungivorans]|nr:hypothetical protein [Collimonas fungivorans]
MFFSKGLLKSRPIVQDFQKFGKARITT